MTDPKIWCERALSSLFSLWNSESGNHHAWRTSERVSSDNRNHHYFPTATFHSVMAFGDCGVWDLEKPFDPGKKTVKTPDLKIVDVNNFSSYDEVFGTLVNQTSGSLGGADWVSAVIGSSSHFMPPADQGDSNAPLDEPNMRTHYHPRQALVIGRLFQALRILAGLAIHEKERLLEFVDSDSTEQQREQRQTRLVLLNSLLARVEEGLPSATQHLCGILRKNIITAPVAQTSQQQPAEMSEIATAAELADSPLVSPFMLLQIAIGLIERDVLLERFGLKPRGEAILILQLNKDVATLKAHLKQYFAGEVDKLMSRRQIPLYPHYDPASLAFSTHGRNLLDDSFASESVFRACIEAVIGDQYADGTWPAGRSPTFDDTGTSIQQPSVAIALSLAECLFEPSLLVDYRSESFQLVSDGLGALRKTGLYLVNSFSANCHNSSSGWVSDRVRWPKVSETWITAMTARLFHLLWLTERAFARHERLKKYSLRPPVRLSKARRRSIPGLPEAPRLEVDLRSEWSKAIIEPDQHAQPAEFLARKVLDPLQKQLDRGSNFVRPAEDGVSFIIFGPPGSGKTFFIEHFAKVLGWPLITLNPGHFIKKGLEFIEAEASGIFDDLMHLDHTVILFDECDELFRMRTEDAGARNILSFATASMLPKLQDLHDARKVVFFLGTNYLAHVDVAVRRPGRFDEILFLDRPDDVARRIHIERTLPAAQLDGSAFSEADIESAVAETRGWMIKDIKSYARAHLSKSAWTEINIEDYERWLAKHGDEELRASRLSPEAQGKIRGRWLPFGLYADREKM
ncbi:MAG TPA: AAA family ATPase [Pyrinomonadaceae bacterium]|jgi:hypothetical protein|nr:AAA family ATPase [Pyrinomonadaceae bacterium]